jgi:hypothetical protein
MNRIQHRLQGTILALAIGIVMVALSAHPGGTAGQIFLEEGFETLDRWQPLTFPKIKRHSTFSASRCDGATCLQMDTNNSASALVFKETFNVHEYSLLTWRWKVSNTFRKGDSSSKEGDDYPARLYVLFAYDPASATLGKKMRYELAKAFYGQYPPDSSISYIWDNQVTGKQFIINAYADEARMIPVNAGPAEANTWQEHRVDIVRDYRLAFGQDPPATASLAVMSDSDNTHETATAWIQFLRLEKPRQ